MQLHCTIQRETTIWGRRQSEAADYWERELKHVFESIVGSEQVEGRESENKLKGNNKKPWKEQMKISLYLKISFTSSVLRWHNEGGRREVPFWHPSSHTFCPVLLPCLWHAPTVRSATLQVDITLTCSHRARSWSGSKQAAWSWRHSMTAGHLRVTVLSVVDYSRGPRPVISVHRTPSLCRDPFGWWIVCKLHLNSGSHCCVLFSVVKLQLHPPQ